MTLIRSATAAVAAILLAAFASAPPALAQMKTQWVDYSHGGEKLKGYMAWDDSKKGKRPAIFIAYDRSGMSDRTRETVEQWSKLGYVVFAADIYGMVPKDSKEMVEQTTRFRKDRALMRARTQAGYDVLAANPMVDASKIALIGYCFGGGVGVEFGSTGVPLVANIAIHGSFGGHEPGWAKNMKGRFVILHGAEDPNYPKEVDVVIAELRGAKAAFEMSLYSGTGHGFSHPKNKDEERANVEAIATTTRMLKELFGS